MISIIILSDKQCTKESYIFLLTKHPVERRDPFRWRESGNEQQAEQRGGVTRSLTGRTHGMDGHLALDC